MSAGNRLESRLEELRDQQIRNCGEAHNVWDHLVDIYEEGVDQIRSGRQIRNLRVNSLWRDAATRLVEDHGECFDDPGRMDDIIFEAAEVLDSAPGRAPMDPDRIQNELERVQKQGGGGTCRTAVQAMYEVGLDECGVESVGDVEMQLSRKRDVDVIHAHEGRGTDDDELEVAIEALPMAGEVIDDLRSAGFLIDDMTSARGAEVVLLARRA